MGVDVPPPPLLARYVDVYELGRAIMRLPEFVPKTTGLHKAAKAFQRNKSRVAASCQFPALISDLINVATQASDQTLVEMVGTIVPTPDKLVDEKEYSAKEENKFKKLFNARLRGEIIFRRTKKGDTGLPHIWWALLRNSIIAVQGASHVQTKVLSRVQTLGGQAGQ